MITMREKGAGQHTEVLVDRAEKREVIDIKGLLKQEKAQHLETFDLFKSLTL